MRDHTRCAGVMIGRGAFGNPWLFRDGQALLGRPRSAAALRTRRSGSGSRWTHARLALRLQGDTRKTVIEFRKHLGWYTKGLHGASDLRQRLFQIESDGRGGGDLPRVPRPGRLRWRERPSSSTPSSPTSPPDAWLLTRRSTGCAICLTKTSTFARIDHHRALRQGHPEVVFCEGKTPEQVVAICERLAAMSGGFLGTRCGRGARRGGARRVPAPRSGRRSRARCTSCRKAGPRRRRMPERSWWCRRGRAICRWPKRRRSWPRCSGTGSSGSPTWASPAFTGCWRPASGCAQADVIIVVAGMEGALPSVVGGLVVGPGHRGPHERGLRRLVRRPRGAPGDAQLLRGRRHRGQHRQRFRRRGGGQPDLRAMTIRTVVETSEPRFTWLDVVDPTREELSELVAEYGLHPLAVNDCLDPEHLPKFEVFDNHSFVILRAVDADAPPTADTVQAADPEARRLRGAAVRDHHPSEGPALAHGADGARAGERATQARHKERGDPGPSPGPALQCRAGYLSAARWRRSSTRSTPSTPRCSRATCSRAPRFPG